MNATPAREQRIFTPGDPERPAFYRRLRALVRVVRHFFFGLDIQGLERIPVSGPLIVASNHLSFWDIPSVALMADRLFHFMAKSEYARNRLARWLFTKLEAFFVRRGEGDMQAMRDALAVLRAGQLLIIYPEGHRSEDQALIPAHEGLALIAFKSGAPVMPVATWGSEYVGKGFHFAFWRPTIHIRYGQPLTFIAAGKRASKEELVAATERIMASIATMLPPSYRGAYASQAAALEEAARDVSAARQGAGSASSESETAIPAPTVEQSTARP